MLALRLDRLCVRTESELFNAVWPSFCVWPPDDLAKQRRKQIAILARHGRQPIKDWFDDDVEEIHVWYVEICELIGEEHPLASKAEEA